MKKSAVFLIFSFVLLGFFACQFTIPTAIEIIGNPSAIFAEAVDIGKMFENLLEDKINRDERLTMIPCSYPDIITNLIHVELINEEYPKLENEEDFYTTFPKADEDIPDFFEDMGGVNTDKKLILLDSENDSKNRLIIQLSDLSSLLPGFKFYQGEDPADQDLFYKARIHFSGSEIIEKTRMNVTIKEIKITVDEDGIEHYAPIAGPEHTHTIPVDELTNSKSEIDKWKEDEYYDGEDCPPGGIDFDIPLTGNDIFISFEVYIPEHEQISMADFDASSIHVELVIWLPFKFIAVEDEAALFFPEDYFFNPEEDLFGREEPDSESLVFDIVENLFVDVKFHNHPFQGRELIISNKDVDIRSPIDNNDEISFTVTEDNMDKINKPENWPFAPNIKIGGFATGDKLSFPKDFNAIQFAFKAKVHYRKDF